MESYDPISGAPISGLSSGLFQNIYQLLSLSDSTSATADRLGIASSSLSLTDSFSENFVFMLSESDTLTLTDSLSLNGIFTRSISDPLSLSDAFDVNYIGRTDVSSTLTLSDSAGYNVNFLRILGDDLILSDIVFRIFQYSISDSLSLTHLALKIDPTVSVSQALTLSDSAEPALTLTRTLVDTLTISDIVHRVLPFSFTDTLTLTSAFDQRNLQQQGIQHSLNLGHGVTYYNNLEFTITDNITITDAYDTRVLPQGNLTHTLALTQLVSANNFEVQRLVGDLVMSDTLTYDLFQQQNILHTLVFGDATTFRNLKYDPMTHGLSLGQQVTVRVVDSGRKFVVDELNITQSVKVNLVSYQMICDCLNIQDLAQRAIEVSVTQTINITDWWWPTNIKDYLELSDVFDINVTFDLCCGRAFVEDKYIIDELHLTDHVSLGIDPAIQIEDNLNLAQTVAYYIL